MSRDYYSTRARASMARNGGYKVDYSGVIKTLVLFGLCIALIYGALATMGAGVDVYRKAIETRADVIERAIDASTGAR